MISVAAAVRGTLTGEVLRLYKAEEIALGRVSIEVEDWSSWNDVPYSYELVRDFDIVAAQDHRSERPCSSMPWVTLLPGRAGR